jgi:hypothetical protein
MPILVNRYFSEITPESAENGEASDNGVIVENEECTFRELVRMMREHWQCSCYPVRGEVYEWLSTGFYTSDYRTGTEREETLHYSRDNPPKNEKYWKWAMRAAGILKGGD